MTYTSNVIEGRQIQSDGSVLYVPNRLEIIQSINTVGIPLSKLSRVGILPSIRKYFIPTSMGLGSVMTMPEGDACTTHTHTMASTHLDPGRLACADKFAALKLQVVICSLARRTLPY